MATMLPGLPYTYCTHLLCIVCAVLVFAALHLHHSLACAVPLSAGYAQPVTSPTALDAIQAVPNLSTMSAAIVNLRLDAILGNANFTGTVLAPNDMVRPTTLSIMNNDMDCCFENGKPCMYHCHPQTSAVGQGAAGT